MIQKLGRSRWALALLVFVAVGYFSNAITATTCERKTSLWLNERLARQPTNWPGRRASSELAEYWLPWIVDVDYEWVVMSHRFAAGRGRLAMSRLAREGHPSFLWADA